MIAPLQELLDKANSARNDSVPELEHDVNGIIGWHWLLVALLMNATAASGGGIVIVNGDAVAYDSKFITYLGSTNNIDTIEYKTGGPAGTTVATMTITYVNGGVADDDLPETAHLT